MTRFVTSCFFPGSNAEEASVTFMIGCIKCLMTKGSPAKARSRVQETINLLMGASITLMAKKHQGLSVWFKLN